MKNRILAGGVVLGMFGCAVDVEQGSDPVAQAEQELVTSNVVNKRGVVQVEVKGQSRCTGVMINHDHVLTDALYVSDDWQEEPTNFVGQARISYFDPDLDPGERRPITGNASEDGDLVEITTIPEGLALIRRPGGWIDTGLTDYQRISRGSCGDIRTGNIYGRGTGGSGHPASVLRSIPYALAGNDCNETAYWAFWDESDKASCTGDVGGPFISKAGEWDVVTGILYWSWGGTPACDPGGKNRDVTRLGDWILPWIEEVTGDTCHEFTVDGHPYARCWDT